MKRGKFSLSNTKLFSCDMGELIPCGLTEILPGDSIQQATTCLVRFSPLLAPVMHPTHVQLAHWFVPHRLVWEDWEDFITGGPNGTDASVFPTITFSGGTGAAVGSLADYMGVPPLVNNLEVSALPFRGYAKIWNEWYRDQDLQTELVVDETSGADTTTATALQYASWEKDYFTTARPWEQKGPAITIPLGTTAPLTGFGMLSGTGAATNRTAIASQLANDWTNQPTWLSSGQDYAIRAQSNNVPSNTNRPQVFADLSGASAITINLLREAFALQRYEEARARFGSRYVEYLRYLGVRSSDARLQRPEFLGGGRYPIQFSEVLQTAEGTDPVGNLAGHGIGVARSNRYRKFFEEHGYVFTFAVTKPKAIYGNALARTFNRRTKEDFFQKELEAIGQQEVLNKEIAANHVTPNGIFGYADRYAEYRGSFSTVAAFFRGGQNLDHWTFQRTIASNAALNSDFIKCIPTEDPFAIPSEDNLYIMAKHQIQARRLVSNSSQSYIY